MQITWFGHSAFRLDFAGKPPATDFEVVVNVESWVGNEQSAQRALRINLQVEAGKVCSWQVSAAKPAQSLATSEKPTQEAKIAFARNFEFRLPLAWLDAPFAPAGGDGKSTSPAASKLRLRFSLWQNHLPTDALPLEGWIELQLFGEQDLMALA